MHCLSSSFATLEQPVPVPPCLYIEMVSQGESKSFLLYFFLCMGITLHVGVGGPDQGVSCSALLVGRPSTRYGVPGCQDQLSGGFKGGSFLLHDM